MIKKVIICFMTIMLFSCKTDKKEIKTDINTSIEEKTVIIEGFIEIGQNNRICISTNTESRSKTTYNIYGNLYDDLAKNMGKKVKVRGKIMKEYSIWNFDLDVVTIF